MHIIIHCKQETKTTTLHASNNGCAWLSASCNITDKLEEIVRNNDTYRALTAFVLTKTFLNNTFRARRARFTSASRFVKHDPLLFGLVSVLRVGSGLWSMAAEINER